ncbi:acyltransferase family protein [Lutibaculum baratangense]|uniref:Acyltransferase 3 domain-containing protein n=1 Tax=Lutibaculum baratangense AMV1 TaxID=631454 RepID=V4RQU3_9HYPH|nr:acyltransferase family protein [Lutibaculum baratangense]ESR25505.1 hypothetical protein N177_1617 [Lutibaculum baratangense AMV1]
MTASHPSVPRRVDWVDVAKGFCIVMVVMMHSTLGVEAAAGATGWLHHVVEFAKPFRMPDFFLVAGLFLALRIDRPWREYLDAKVVHFAYFYVLWVTIQFAMKSPPILAESGAEGVVREYLLAYVEPFGTLWFIYLLPIFFVVTKLLRRVPVVAVLAVAAALEIAPIHTGSVVIDEFAARYVYFYAGYALAPHIFAFASRIAGRPALGLAYLGVWGVVNGTLVAQGVADMPFVGLALGTVGAIAVVTFSVLLVGTAAAEPLRYCGERSIVIYLAFFVFMAGSRVVLLKTGIIPDLGTVSLIVTAAGVVGPLVLAAIVRPTPLAFLFRRPAWTRIDRREPKLVPAE